MRGKEGATVQQPAAVGDWATMQSRFAAQFKVGCGAIELVDSLHRARSNPN